MTRLRWGARGIATAACATLGGMVFTSLLRGVRAQAACLGPGRTLCAGLAFVSACGGGTKVDSATTSSSTSATTTTSTTTSTSSTTSSTTSTTSTTTTTTSTTTGTGVACGPALTCKGNEACVVDEKEPSCGPPPEDGGVCPGGTTLGECGGGAGTFPCCCSPPPPLEYRCVSAADCGGEPTCACVVTNCPQGQMCQAYGGDPPTLHCIEMPKP